MPGLLLLVALLLPLPSTGQPASSDTTLADSLQRPSPRAALVRSAILPGWGQLYNGRPGKALFFAGATAGFLGSVIVEQRALNLARTSAEHEDRAARRNTRLLFVALSATFAALDAYVDAHLADFGTQAKIEIRPGGVVLLLNSNPPP